MYGSQWCHIGFCCGWLSHLNGGTHHCDRTYKVGWMGTVWFRVCVLACVRMCEMEEEDALWTLI